jgi:peptidyl-prolyl cis-trans isomerase D
MFDLFRSRAKAVRYLLGGLLVLVALSMVTYLIPGYGSSTNTTEDPAIATICGNKLTQSDVRRTLDRFVRSGQFPGDMLDVLAPQFIDSMIDQRAVVCEANRLGLNVSDEEVRNGLESTYTGFFQNGQLVSKPAVEQMLQQQGLTIPEWIENMRSQLAMKKLTDLAQESVIVTQAEAVAEFTKKRTKVKIQYIAFPQAKFRGQVKVTPEEIKAFFDAHRNEFTQPEKRGFALVVVDEARVASLLQPTESELRASYNNQRDRFRNEERVHVRHILVMTKDKPEAEKTKLKAKAEDLLKQLKSGANFAELAKKNSDDPSSAAKGGDLEWIQRGQTEPSFEKAAFSMKPNDPPAIAESPFGFHIMQVLAKEAPRTKSFEEVKAQLAEEFKKQGALDKMQALAEEVRAELAKNPKEAEQIAKKRNLEFAMVEKAGRGDSLPLVGVSPEVEGAITALKIGDVSPVAQLPANRLAIAVVTSIYPVRLSELSEAEPAIRERLLGDKAGLLATEKAKEAAAKIEKGADAAQVAKQYGLEVASPAEFARGENVDGLGATQSLDVLFTKTPGSVTGPLMVQGRNVIFKTVEIKSPDPAELASSRDQIIKEIKSRRSSERQDLFYDSIMSRLIAEGKVKKNNDAVRRLIASYRRQ